MGRASTVPEAEPWLLILGLRNMIGPHPVELKGRRGETQLPSGTEVVARRGHRTLPESFSLATHSLVECGTANFSLLLWFLIPNWSATAS